MANSTKKYPWLYIENKPACRIDQCAKRWKVRPDTALEWLHNAFPTKKTEMRWESCSKYLREEMYGWKNEA